MLVLLRLSKTFSPAPKLCRQAIWVAHALLLRLINIGIGFRIIIKLASFHSMRKKFWVCTLCSRFLLIYWCSCTKRQFVHELLLLSVLLLKALVAVEAHWCKFRIQVQKFRNKDAKFELNLTSEMKFDHVELMKYWISEYFLPSCIIVYEAHNDDGGNDPFHAIKRPEWRSRIIF